MVNGKRPGRPPGSSEGQREAILGSARQLFSSRGFTDTTMRAIAAAAGVNVALLAHYFTNKEGLFLASMELPDSAESHLVHALQAPVERRGMELTRAYLHLWEAPETGEQLQAVARTAVGSQGFGTRMDGILAHMFSSASRDAPDASSELATTLALNQLLGVAIARHVLKVPATTRLTLDELVNRVAPGIQGVLDHGIG